jgi:hypothetical protein
MSLRLGIVVFLFLVVVAHMLDPVGVGYLLSSDVDRVADARLAEAPLSIPLLYIVAALAAGVGAVVEFPELAPLARWAIGVAFASFLVLTIWDVRRRRGTLAVYIRLRRREIGSAEHGDVIEAPKLMFLVMSQPTPIVWLMTGIVLVLGAIVAFPTHAWMGALALVALAALLVWLWARNRTSPWERLARHLRWVSLRSGDALIDRLHHALDLDPEVAMLRREADAVVARFVRDHN